MHTLPNPSPTPTLADIQRTLMSLVRGQDEITNRAKRTETRLTQLMLHEGMQSDGRKTLVLRGDNHVG